MCLKRRRKTMPSRGGPIWIWVSTASTPTQIGGRHLCVAITTDAGQSVAAGARAVRVDPGRCMVTYVMTGNLRGVYAEQVCVENVRGKPEVRVKNMPSARLLGQLVRAAVYSAARSS